MAKPPAGLRSQGDCSETDPKKDKQRGLTAVGARTVDSEKLRKRCSSSVEKYKNSASAGSAMKIRKMSGFLLAKPTLSGYDNPRTDIGDYMTDGPFKNAELSNSWKEYGETLVSEAMTPEDRAEQACRAMLADEDLKAFSGLISELMAYAQQPQKEFFPEMKVESIFDSHDKSTLVTGFQKHLSANMYDHIPLESAIPQALKGAVNDWIGMTKNRMDEQCISARDRGDMKRPAYEKGILCNQESFAAIKADRLCDSLVSGQAGPKVIHSGIEDGPD